jgi:Tfp pilus assembly protein PilX
MRMTGSNHQPIGPWRRRPGRSRQRHSGAATLAVAVIMLLVVSMLVFHSHAAGWLEQRATANQTRAKQAHAAAEAGLEVALSVLNADAGPPNRATHLTASPTQAGRFAIANATLNGSPGAALAYSVTLAGLAADAPPLARLQIIANGGSDCTNLADVNTCSGRAAIQQVVEIEPLFPYLPGSPPQVIRSFTSFDSVFSAPEATIKALTTPVTSGAGFSTATTGLVWHQGNLTLGGSVGSDASPVLLVVEGNLTIPAGVDVRGFVFVTGAVTCTGCASPSIRGAIAAAGANGLAAGQAELPADAVNGPLARVGSTAIRFAKVMGTWRDW